MKQLVLCNDKCFKQKYAPECENTVKSLKSDKIMIKDVEKRTSGTFIKL